MKTLISLFDSEFIKKFGGLLGGLLAFFLFSKVIFFGFSNYDDNIYLTSNEFVKNLTLTNIAYIFTHQFYGHYFPITLTFTSFQYFFFGDWAGGYHLMNLLVHTLNTILVFELIKKFRFKPSEAFFAALVFGLHPIQVETVAWLGATNNVLATFFMLSAWLFYFVYLEKKTLFNYLILLTLFLVGCLSKSSAIVFPILLFIIDIYLENKAYVKAFLLKLPLLVFSVLFGLISVKAANHFGSLAPVLESYSWFNVPFLVLYQLCFYGVLFIMPFRLKIRYNNPIEVNGLLPIEYYAAVIFIFIIVGIFLYSKSKKQLLFLLSWFIVAVGLTLKFRYSTNVIGADRYAYFFLPVFPLLLLNIKSINKYFKYGFLLLIVFISVVFTFQRLEVWRNSKTLFQDLVENADGDSKPFLFRGLNFIKEKQYEAALIDLETAVKIDSTSAKNRNAFATANLLLDKKQEAKSQYKKAIELDPKLPNPYFHLGNIYGAEAEYQKSEQYFLKHLELNPSHGETYFWLGNIRIIDENYFGALQQYKKAEEHNYLTPALQINKGYCYLNLEENAKACAAFIKAKEMGSPNADALIAKHCI